MGSADLGDGPAGNRQGNKQKQDSQADQTQNFPMPQKGIARFCVDAEKRDHKNTTAQASEAGRPGYFPMAVRKFRGG